MHMLVRLGAALCAAAALVVGDLLQVAPREDLAYLIKTQEQTIRKLQALVNELAHERTQLLEQVRLLNTTTASAGSVAASTHGALKAEVRRLLARGAHAAAAGGGTGDDEAAPPSDEAPWARPQQIALACKGEVDVDVRPLEEDDRGSGECMVLRVTGGELSARFVLYCDGAQDTGEEEEEEGGAGGGEDGVGGRGDDVGQ